LSFQNCNDKLFFRRNTTSSLILTIMLSILALSLLIYRQRVLKAPFWNGKLFAPLDGLLFWLLVWSALKAATAVIKLYDLWPTSSVKYILFNACWWTPNIAVATYVCGLFYAIPRMQPLQTSSTTRTVYLVSPSSIPYLYWSFIVFNVILFETLTMLAIKCRFAKRSALEVILWKVHWSLIILEQLLLIAMLLYYGRMLVRLARDCISVTGDKRKYESFANKMNSANIGFTVAYIFYILLIMCFIFFAKRIHVDQSANKIYAVIMENWSAILGNMVIVAMIYCEVKQVQSPLTKEEIDTGIWTLNEAWCLPLNRFPVTLM